MLRYALKMSTELESNLTAIERVVDYTNIPQEVFTFYTKSKYILDSIKR